MESAQVDVTVSALHWESAVFDVLSVHVCVAMQKTYNTHMELSKYSQYTVYTIK